MEVQRLVAQVEFGADKAILGLAGEIDLETAPVLARHIDTVIDRGLVHLVLDTRAVDFADSTFVSAVMRTRDIVVPKGGSISIVAQAPAVRRLLDITGISTVPGVIVVAG